MQNFKKSDILKSDFLNKLFLIFNNTNLLSIRIIGFPHSNSNRHSA